MKSISIWKIEIDLHYPSSIMSTFTPTPLSKILHDLLLYIRDEKRPVDETSSAFEATLQEVQNRFFPILPGRPNLAIFFSGRIIGYENNLLNLLETFESLSHTYNLYLFISINGFLDIYHAKFCRIFGIGPDQRNFYIFLGNARYYNFLRNRFTNIYNTTSMWYNSAYCIKLITEYIYKYHVYMNVVMKYRTEAVYVHSPISITERVLPNTVYVPHGFDHTGLNDQIAYGNYETMNGYTWLAFDVAEYVKIPGFFFHPETNLRNHLLEKKIPVERIDFPYFFRGQLSKDFLS